MTRKAISTEVGLDGIITANHRRVFAIFVLISARSAGLSD
jgi:hypothetical protein